MWPIILNNFNGGYIIMEKGKKLSWKQREIMKKNGILDCTDWVYIKQMMLNEDGGKNLSSKGAKSVYMIVLNKVTGEQKKLLIV